MAEFSLLEKLKHAVGTELIESDVISSNEVVKFLPISIKQQKEIIKTAMDSIMSPVTFSITINDIIKNNSSIKKDFYIIDKPIILLNLRKNSVSDEIKLTKDTKTATITITEILKNYKPKINILDFNKNLTEGSITIVTKLPTLDDDTKINLEVKKLFDKHKDEEKLREIVGELFVTELLKYIKEVKFIENQIESVIDFNTLSFDQKIKTFETLPMNLNYKLVKLVSSVRDIEKALLEVTIDNENYSIVLDSGFFFRD